MVGAGRAGYVHAQNLTEHTPDAVVVAVVDGEPDRAKSLARRVGTTGYHTTLDEALEETSFDAVVISTPTFTHRDLAVQAAGAGKHVFCEKPMALTAWRPSSPVTAGRSPLRATSTKERISSL